MNVLCIKCNPSDLFYFDSNPKFSAKLNCSTTGTQFGKLLLKVIVIALSLTPSLCRQLGPFPLSHEVGLCLE